MPNEIAISIAYHDIYSDFESVDITTLLKDIPTKSALALICHYTGQIHTQEKDDKFQMDSINDWSKRLNISTREKINEVILELSKNRKSSFNFINNVSSLYLIQSLLVNHNNLPEVKDLTIQQEENLFKAYLYYSSIWTKEQEAGILNIDIAQKNYENVSLIASLPYHELFEFKDFRIQFLKAIYFFKFCESNELFKGYLEAFLEAREIKSWNSYLANLLSVYITLFQEDTIKTSLEFSENSKDVFSSLETFCVDIETFEQKKDFLSLRETPIYKNARNELLFLNINFLIDKIYQSIIFDFASIVIDKGLQYKGKNISGKPQFFGIFGDEFIEQGLFYKLMQHIFRQKDYVHYTGDELKRQFGDGTPDYLIIDNAKIYVFEFKNAMFKGTTKYSFDIDEIKNEIDTKLVRNDKGRPKGITQLVNFVEDVSKGRYEEIIGKNISKYIIYPVLVTTDVTFTLPVIPSFVSTKFDNILTSRNLTAHKLTVKKLTMVDIDSVIKFQDLFISKKLTLNHVLNDYQTFLSKGVNKVDKSLSFNQYIHWKTSKLNYDTPKLFWEEIEKLFQMEI